MPEIFLIGLNHKTAPVEIRERLAFSSDETPQVLEKLHGNLFIDEAVIQFNKWREGMEIIPTVIALREKITRITKAEVEKSRKSLKHLSDKDHQVISRMAEALAQKVLHDPTLFLKNDMDSDDKFFVIDFTRKLFNLG